MHQFPYFSACLQIKDAVANEIMMSHNNQIPMGIINEVFTEWMSNPQHWEATLRRMYPQGLNNNVLMQLFRTAMVNAIKKKLAMTQQMHQMQQLQMQQMHGMQHMPLMHNAINPSAPPIGDSGALTASHNMSDDSINDMVRQTGISTRMAVETAKPVEIPAEEIKPKVDINSIKASPGRLAKDSEGNPYLIPGGCVMQFIPHTSPDLTTNQKIVIMKGGNTQLMINSGLLDLKRDLVEVHQYNEVVKRIQYDEQEVEDNDKFFENSRDLYDFLIGNLSASDNVYEYFRLVKYASIHAIPIEHDLFFKEFDNLNKVLIDKVPEINNMDTAKAAVNILIKQLGNCEKLFAIALENYLVGKANKLFKSIMRFHDRPSLVVKISALGDFMDFYQPSKDMDIIRDYPLFDVALTFIIAEIIKFTQFNSETAPIFIDMDEKRRCMTPYIKTNKFSSYVPNEKGLTTNDYWYWENRDVTKANAIVRAMKSKVLITEPRLTIVTNILTPGIIRELMCSVVKTPIVVPKEVVLKDNVLSLKNADDKLFALLNKSTDHAKGVIPDDLILALGNDKIMDFHIASTLNRNFIIES